MPSQELIDELVGNAHGNLARVQEILTEHPELVNASSQWGETPIQAAAQMGDKVMAEYLLGLGAPLDICTAAMLGRSSDVEAMLTFDPSLAYATGAHGIPVLDFPILHAELAIAEMLLAEGAAVNAGDGMMTSLHAAATADQPEMAKWLLANGARISLTNFDGKTALEVAEARGHESVVGVLRESA